MLSPDLKQMLALSDHVGQALSGSQVLVQIFLIRATGGVLPLDWPRGEKEFVKYR